MKAIARLMVFALALSMAAPSMAAEPIRDRIEDRH